MKISDLNIPEQVKQILHKRGLNEFYPPQEEALKMGVLNGRNLVLASPTASGKTLIAELCALKHVVENGGKVLYLSPLRALAWEMYETFKEYSSVGKKDGMKIQVGISTGDLDSSTPWLDRYDVLITTNEKCDSLLRHRAPWMNGISLVIADEIHLIGGDRGPTLEVALARLRQMKPDVQILAMSATIQNAEEVAEWLNARFVTTNWRPVELREGVYHNNRITFRKGSIKKLEPLHKSDALNISLNSVLEGDQALIFVESRRRAMSLARDAGSAISGLIPKRELRDLQKVAADLLLMGEKTRLSEDLASTAQKGAAFHHAGLRTEHRRIVENSFKAGKIKIIVATPTLAAGVNLPARTVVIGSYRRFVPGYGMYPISVMEYKQMSGRAGRPQYDKFGESVLIANSSENQDELMENYVLGKPERLYSRLAQDTALRSHTLAAIASDYSHTEGGLVDFFGGTFYGYHYPTGNIQLILGTMLRYLRLEDMIQYKGEYIYATDFGRRVSELYIDPLSAVLLRDGLRKGAPNVTDFTWLHLVCHTPNMRPIMRPRRNEAGAIEDYVEEHRDEFACSIPEYDNYIDYEQFLGEVKTAVVLKGWIDEMSESDLLERFSVQPGDRYNAIHNAEWLLYSSHQLAGVLELPDHRRQLKQLRDRVKYGVTKPLLPLVNIRSIGRVRARILYKSGFTTISSLKKAPVNKLIEIPLIGVRIAKLIKEQVGGIISEEEWRKLETEDKKQKTLTDFTEEDPNLVER